MLTGHFPRVLHLSTEEQAGLGWKYFVRNMQIYTNDDSFIFFMKTFLNIKSLTCVWSWVSARALVVDACQVESIAAEGGALRCVAVPTTVLRNAQTYKIHTLTSCRRTEFLLLFFKGLIWKKYKYILYQLKTVIRALFSFLSRFIMWKRTVIRSAYLNLLVSTDLPRDTGPWWVWN